MIDTKDKAISSRDSRSITLTHSIKPRMNSRGAQRHYLHLTHIHAHLEAEPYKGSGRRGKRRRKRRTLRLISGNVEHGARGTGSRPHGARTLPQKYARTHTVRRIPACVRACVRTYARAQRRACPRVDATDNMQLRAVSSALSCSAVRARSALSPVERPRHAWRKRRGHAEYADNEMLQTVNPRGAFRVTSINSNEIFCPSLASSFVAPNYRDRSIDRLLITYMNIYAQVREKLLSQ